MLVTFGKIPWSEKSQEEHYIFQKNKQLLTMELVAIYLYM